MGANEDRGRIQVKGMNLREINDALRRLSDQISRLEGRSGGVSTRDNVGVTSEKQTLMDLSGGVVKSAIALYGTTNPTLAIANGARRTDAGEWVATDIAATIWEISRAGIITVYSNTGLTIEQAFSPTLYTSFDVVTALVNINGNQSSYPQVWLKQTGENVAGGILLFYQGKTPADGDIPGYIQFAGKNDALADKAYAYIHGYELDVSSGTEDGQIYFNILGAGAANYEMLIQDGQVYIYNNCSALSYTDRTPAPKDKKEAYDIVNSCEIKDGKVDKSKLHAAVKVTDVHYEKDKDGKIVGTPEEGRNLSMLVSSLTEVLKDLVSRVDKLEAKI